MNPEDIDAITATKKHVQLHFQWMFGKKIK